VRISGSNAEYTMFRGSVNGTGYPLHSSISPSLPLPCVTVCHHVSPGLYINSYYDCYLLKPFVALFTNRDIRCYAARATMTSLN